LVGWLPPQPFTQPAPPLLLGGHSEEMKVLAFRSPARPLLLAALALGTLFPQGVMASKGDKTITRVVKILEGMMTKSKEDGAKDRELYAKLKCYCDTKEEEKTNEIAELTKEIDILGNEIEELQSSNGVLSTECAKLDADMAANLQARDEAEAIRKKEHDSFVLLEADLTTAIKQMDQAIETLSEVGADQTLGQAAADHKTFMASYKQASLLKLQGRVKEALSAASAFMPAGGKERNAVASLLQAAPFAATYTAQSGEVVGILKDMRDTFKENLETATETEKAQLDAHTKYMTTALAAYQTMEKLHDEKQGTLSSNDGDLSAKTQQLSQATKQKGVCEDMLSQLLPMCEKKAKEFEQRNMLRAQENAAISEAIAILNKDASFKTFSTVAATSTGEVFLQRRSAVVRRHGGSDEANSARLKAALLLQRVGAGAGGSQGLGKVAALLRADNPFDVVLAEIKKMVALIAEEGTADKQQLEWCNVERTATTRTIEEKGAEILRLNGAIAALESDIEAPEVGLKAMIASTEQSLETNFQSQKDQSEQRTEENQAYQADIANLQSAQELLKSAINVLSKYYAKLEKHAVGEAEEPAVFAGESDAHPETWEAEKGYKGQSEKGVGAVGMLEFILTETQTEEKAAHKEELEAQHAFEDSMGGLKTEEAKDQAMLVELERTLAEKEKELLGKRNDLKATEADKAAAIAYLASIKPGCDFITENIELRDGRRASETAALNGAQRLLRETPAYQAVVAEAAVEALGPCQGACEASRQHVACKACLAKVTIPAYCAGHEGTEGCSRG